MNAMAVTDRSPEIQPAGPLIQRVLGDAADGSGGEALAGRMRLVEYVHAPPEGGLCLIASGTLDEFIRPVSAGAVGQPAFVGCLTAGDAFLLPPGQDRAGRTILMIPEDKVTLHLLPWADLLALLREGGPAAGPATLLLMSAEKRSAGLQLKYLPSPPAGWRPRVSEIVPSEGESAWTEAAFAGIAPRRIAAGETWNDPAAAGVFIADGRFQLGRENRMFGARGRGVQATWGAIDLKAETAGTLYPLAPADLAPGRISSPAGTPLALSLALSLRDLAGPLTATVNEARKACLENYLERSRLREKAGRAEQAAALASLQVRHRTMPLIPATDPDGAWDAAIAMVARYLGQKQPPETGDRTSADPEGKKPVERRAARFGLLSRRVSIAPGSLRVLSSPLIAVTKAKTPLVLEPFWGRLWAHDPLKGSYRVSPGDLEPELPGIAFELTPVLDEKALNLPGMLRSAFSRLPGWLGRLAGAALLAVLFGLVTPIATKLIFGTVVPSSDRNALNSIGLAILACALAAAGFTLISSWLFVSLMSLGGISLSSAIMSHLLRLPVGFFRKFSLRDLALRIETVDLLRQYLTPALVSTGINGVFSLAYLAVMFHYAPRLALWALALTALAAGLLFLGARVTVGRLRAMLAMRATEQSFLYELIRGILTVRTSAAAGRLSNRWLKFFSGETELDYLTNRARMWPTILFSSYPVFGILVIYLGATPRIISGQIAFSDFIAFSTAFAVFFTALCASCQAAMTLTSLRPLWERAVPLLGAKEERVRGGLDPGRLRGRLELSGCSFRYREEGPEIIRNLSFTVEPGEFVALTGPSGAGKSTLVRLLLGFERPGAGAIFYDRYDLEELDVGCIRRQIGVVLQESQLIPGSIKENLLVNAPRATLEEMIAAAEAADIHRDIMAMPMRYETLVAEGGETFSGGQLQRMAIARALVSKPAILFFDEATSSLDNSSQEQIQKSLEKLNVTLTCPR